jgi:SAM-dependent methyltransferase
MNTRLRWKRYASRAKRLVYRVVTPLDRARRWNDRRLLPPAHLRLYYYRGVDPDLFARGCETAARELISRGLQPQHRVLDIGSGVGNLALGLVEYLHGGYDGVEIHREATVWCQKAITGRYPGFRFHHADLQSRAYNPGGRLSAADYRFPFPDRSFDFVLLSSVFTHMLPDAVERYLEEIARVLAPGGVAVESYFLLNDESRRGVEEGRSFIRFAVRHPSGLCRLHDAETPESAVAVEEEFVLGVHASVGLRVRDIRRGGWWRGEPHEQDIITAVRSTSDNNRTQ